MYKNLEAEMKRHSIARIEVAKCINKSLDSVHRKMRGEHPFTITEAIDIWKTFFPETDFIYLWEDTENKKEVS